MAINGDLRSRMIRLARTKPELRPFLLSLLKVAGSPALDFAKERLKDVSFTKVLGSVIAGTKLTIRYEAELQVELEDQVAVKALPEPMRRQVVLEMVNSGRMSDDLVLDAIVSGDFSAAQITPAVFKKLDIDKLVARKVPKAVLVDLLEGMPEMDYGVTELYLDEIKDFEEIAKGSVTAFKGVTATYADTEGGYNLTIFSVRGGKMSWLMGADVNLENQRFTSIEDGTTFTDLKLKTKPDLAWFNDVKGTDFRQNPDGSWSLLDRSNFRGELTQKFIGVPFMEIRAWLGMHGTFDLSKASVGLLVNLLKLRQGEAP